MDLYCTIQDVRDFFGGAPHISGDVFKESQVTNMIAAAMSKVNAILKPAYGTKIPFVEPNIPPTVRYDTALLAASYLIYNQTSQTEPNKSDWGRLRMEQVIKQLQAIRDCDEALYYDDGTIVQREAPCPKGKDIAGSKGGCIGINTGHRSAKFYVDMTYTDRDFGGLGE